MRRADTHYANKDWVAARDSLGLAASLAPNDPQILGALGSLHFRLKDYREARASFIAATGLRPNDPDLHLQLAMAYRELAQAGNAQTALRRVLALRPDDPTATKLLADLYLEQHLHQAAATLYGTLLDRHPDRIGVLLSLAKCFAALGDHDGTQAALEEALKIDPTNAAARAALGSVTQGAAIAAPSSGRIQVVETIEELKSYFGLKKTGSLLEEDLDVVENDCELNGRKRRDAEVLCTLAANATGDALELGTSHGRGAFKLGSNLEPRLHCHTVNILPEQHDASGGKLVTHLIPKEAIGSFYRERGVTNITQYFANTARWDIPANIRNLSLIFIDAAHDEENVYLDSKLVWDRLAPGGFMVWHDFSQFSNHFEWIAASMRGVERFRQEYGLTDIPVVNLRHSWCGVMRKPHPVETVTPVVQTLAQAGPGEICFQSQATAAPLSPKGLRYMIVYPQYSDERRIEEDQLTTTLKGCGYDVESFGLPCPGGWWHFQTLDEKWRARAPELMSMYEKLEDRLRNKDVMIASGGGMLHPEFVRQLPTFNVFVCADDPESSAILSRPAAPAFDFAFPINIACVDDYRRWGCRNVDWLFAPVRPELCAPELTEELILRGPRDLDITLLCERVFNLSDRAQRIERLVSTFPHAFVRGPGWPGGAVEAPPVYRRSKIGWNLHNSTGPCNSRTTMLPAFGVLQICDNKSNLGKMFALDREVVGFDSIDECIEKTRYYLAHETEARLIAAAGWKRVHRDYTLDRWWDKLVKTIFPATVEKFGKSLRPHGHTSSHVAATVAAASLVGDENAAPLPVSAQTGPELPVLTPDGEKPRVLMLVDRRGWAYDTAAQAISKRLADEFEFRIEYVRENPDLNAWKFDLLYVFFWGETYHQKFIKDPRRIIKEISSHRWATEEAYGRLTAEEAAKRYLSDAGTLTATSRRLQSLFAPYREVHWCPNGFESDLFAPAPLRRGPLRIGWAGNRNDPCKGLVDVLEPAARDNFELVIAGGDLDAEAMGKFYRSVDVLCVASTAEGEPLTLVEGMASGAFPVAVDVGIVPELVRHGEDGLVISRNPAAFQAAFQWCHQNIDRVRATGQTNARRLTTERRWEDVAIHWRRTLRTAYRSLASSQVGMPGTSGQFFERNLGVNLGQWPERAQAAAAAITSLPLHASASLIDMGCGHQTLKSLLPATLEYVPVDRIARAPNVTVVDFNQSLPETHHTIATFLGVLEYFENSPRLIQWAARHVRYLVLSYNDCSSPVRREKQHWESTLGFLELEETIQRAGGRIIRRQDLGRAELLYVAEFAQRREASGRIEVVATPRPEKPVSKTLALFSAAVNGDNSGDALIADSTQRILGANAYKVFPLLQPLSPAQIEEVNSCDLGVICGTNLYQHVFACSLTPAMISQLRIPILPLGIGASAAIGGRPVMDADGARAVRMIHERCALGSVRDPVSLAFVRSLGISNVQLTGCPVLFHGLKAPVFAPPSTDRLFLSVRARLLHVEEHWNQKQLVTLRRICRDYRPTLVLQSPYDIPIADDLVREFGLESLQADNWDAAHMVKAVSQASRVVGFRLHFGMLALSHGKPSTFLATDTRTSAFCEMMGVPFHAVQSYRDEDLIAELHGPQPGMDRFLTNWRHLRTAMAGLLEANGLNHALNPTA